MQVSYLLLKRFTADGYRNFPLRLHLIMQLLVITSLQKITLKTEP